MNRSFFVKVGACPVRLVGCMVLATVSGCLQSESGGATDAGHDGRAVSAPAPSGATTPDAGSFVLDAGVPPSTDAAAASEDVAVPAVDAGTLADAGGPDAAPDSTVSAPPPDASPDVALAPSPDAGGPTLDLHQVTLFDNPANLADWPVTTVITDVEFEYMGQDGIHVEFSKRDGAGSWPDVTPPGWSGSLEYTLGMIENIGGQWYGSAAIQFWRGLPASGGNVAQDTVTLGPCTTFGLGSTCQVAKNWYYDGRWGALAGYQPATEEMIGIFVVAGNVRGVTDGSQSPVQERSNVVLVPMAGFAGAKYTF